MLFFERDTRDMQSLTGGNALFFRNRIDIQYLQLKLKILKLILMERISSKTNDFSTLLQNKIKK